jgi:hypothetical protein
VRRCHHHIQQWEDQKTFHLEDHLAIDPQNHRKTLCELVEQREDHQADLDLVEN